ncbi:MAG: 4-hydroxythreonine-4-phosphate dehydrogenase PdxA [Treponema sp.]|jgi:4-hydroxythreonine-4-phosphate dehydrogenase|nr:4-hydroxythreonine-4-phosphate dehydrogenase PdxA [Treponema sp.]
MRAEDLSAVETGTAYFFNIESAGPVNPGEISAAGGKLSYDCIVKAVDLERSGIVDALIMAPITKQALHAAGLEFSSDFEIFADCYGVNRCTAVIKCENFFRSTVVGHYAFREITSRLTTDGIINTAHTLLDIMGRFLPKENCRIAVAALNPHAGEDGLFGDEEAVLITPAIKHLQAEGIKAQGPCPADTVFLKARNGEVEGIVYLYHDQGNIAMKAAFFGEAVLIYTGIPGHVFSVGHGSALDIAGKGKADPKNLILCIKTVLEMPGISRV